jgi:ribose transport system substrate-binding protein
MTVATYLNRPRPARAEGYKFAACLGWGNYDSGRHLIAGYKDAVAKLGGELTMVDGSLDPKKQVDQIDAAVATKPDALFVTPSGPTAIVPAVKRAIDAGIPVFCGDSQVPGVNAVSTVMSNNFGMGDYTARYIAQQLKGKGNVIAVTLPINETWAERGFGMEWAFRNYPDIKVVGVWPYADASMTPRQVVDALLTAHKDVDALWCAWDGPAIEGTRAIIAAGRENILITGNDGGKQAFESIRASKTYDITMAQSFYEMTYLSVLYAHEHLAGRPVPRLVIAPTYPVTKAQLPQGPLPDEYDQPGGAEKLGWIRVC